MNGYTISECSLTAITESGTFSVNYVAEGAAPHTVMLKVNGEEYGTASLSKTGEVQEGTQVTLTATPNTSSDSVVAYYVDSVEITGATLSDNTFTVGSEPVEVTVTFKACSITAKSDVAIAVNG